VQARIDPQDISLLRPDNSGSDWDLERIEVYKFGLQSVSLYRFSSSLAAFHYLFISLMADHHWDFLYDCSVSFSRPLSWHFTVA
jgi:hypothetical protein